MKNGPLLSDEQQQAVSYRDSACVLSSGAGCGKTTVLSARFRSLLSTNHEQDGIAVPHIAAITFTERAAREMRKRIRGDMTRELAGATDSDTRNQWQSHLRQLDSATIQTIHSFCSSLLRQFPTEAGLDPEFTVLDETAASALRASTVRNCLQKWVAEHSEYTSDLHELIVLSGWRSVVASMERLVMEPDVTSWQVFLHRSPAEISKDWLGPLRKRLLSDWLAFLRSANPAIAACFHALEQVEPSTKQCADVFDSIRIQYDCLKDSRNLREDVELICEIAKVKSIGTKKNWPVEADYERVKEALGEFRETLKARLEAFMEEDVESVQHAADVAQRVMRVAMGVHDEVHREKKRRAVVDFYDQIALARTLLNDHVAVRESLRSRFRALMVDEFQDTDPLQLDVVQLLCGEGGWPEKLFVVGDEKQSIYRFRGAEVGLFRSLREQIPESGRLSLSTNYRSRPGILRFVNALFAKRLDGYEPLVPNRPESGLPADVEFLWTMPGEGKSSQSADDLRNREADSIARRIRSLINDEERHLPATTGKGGQSICKRDIVLLFRSMSNVAIYEAALRRYDIDYYLVGGRAFYAQQEIYDLLNLLKSLDNPLDGPALVGTLRSPFFGLSDDSLTVIASHRDGVWAGLFDEGLSASIPESDRSRAKQARRHFSILRTIKDSVGISELLHRAIVDSGYDAALQFEPLADRKLANLWKLLERAREYDLTSVGLAGFVAQLDELIVQQPREEQAATRPEDDNVVRLMSIHQAKGLEFPVVFIPDLASRTQQGQGDMVRWHRELGCLVRLPSDVEEADAEYFSELPVQLGQIVDQLADWQEELRVLYVACTRAEERLILSSSWKVQFDHNSPTMIPKGGSNHWTMTLAEQFDLRTGQCLDRTHDVNVDVSIDIGDEPEITPIGDRKDASVWLPRLNDQTACSVVVSLPAVERNLPVSTIRSDFRLPPLLRLIPEPSAEERLFALAWFDTNVKSTWFDRFRNSDLGKRFFAGTERLIQREFTYHFSSVTLFGCHVGVSKSSAGVLVVGFDTDTARDPRPGLILSAWIVAQSMPTASVSAEIFKLKTSQSEVVIVSESSVIRANQTIQTWIAESLGVEVD